MLKIQYQNFLKEQARAIFPTQDIRIFIFGSAVERKNFHDVDLGIMGQFDEKLLYQLKEILEESTFPYLVDIVNFNKVDADFKNFVLNQNLIWL